jgi:tetratricopeptide (TPR) repeat protein
MKNSSSILGLLYKVLPNALNYYDQARYYYSNKQYDIAETHIKQALELDPAMINGHIQYGEINFE